jgi:hypothetical protein
VPETVNRSKIMIKLIERLQWEFPGILNRQDGIINLNQVDCDAEDNIA